MIMMTVIRMYADVVQGVEDSLAAHSGMGFSTRDVDNDAFSTDSCARLRHGAWWFKGMTTNGQPSIL